MKTASKTLQKKILLINPPNAELGQRVRTRNILAGLCERQVQLQKGGFEVVVLDAVSHALNFFAIMQAIRRQAPHAVVFHLTWNATTELAHESNSFVGLLCAHLRRAMPHLQVSVGTNSPGTSAMSV